MKKITLDDFHRILDTLEKKREKVFNQAKTRKKYQKIKCPKCGKMSKPVKEFFSGFQQRECRNGHTFYYDYTLQALEQWQFNYKIKI